MLLLLGQLSLWQAHQWHLVRYWLRTYLCHLGQVREAYMYQLQQLTIARLVMTPSTAVLNIDQKFTQDQYYWQQHGLWVFIFTESQVFKTVTFWNQIIQRLHLQFSPNLLKGYIWYIMLLWNIHSLEMTKESWNSIKISKNKKKGLFYFYHSGNGRVEESHKLVSILVLSPTSHLL